MATKQAAFNGRMDEHLSPAFLEASSGVRTRQIICTPQMADEFLKRNCNNRKLSSTRVAFLVRQIVDGNWMMTHQGIAFWDDGTLADGQHRLTAIVRAGKSVPVMMTTGLQKPAIHAIDMGRPRSTVDILRFVGMDISPSMVSAARILYIQREMARAGNSTWLNVAIPTEAFQQFISLARPAIEFGAIHVCAKGLSHSCFHAAISAAWFTQDREKLSRFKVLVADGLDAAPEESAAIRLRDFLMTTNLTRGGSAARQEVFTRCCTAMRAFLEGRSITKLFCRPDAAFPIPEDADL